MIIPVKISPDGSAVTGTIAGRNNENRATTLQFFMPEELRDYGFIIDIEAGGQKFYDAISGDFNELTYTLKSDILQSNPVRFQVVAGRDADDPAREIVWKSNIFTMQVSDSINAESEFDPDEHTDILLTLQQEIDSKLGDAPKDGEQYARQNGAWEVVEGGGGGDGKPTSITSSSLDVGGSGYNRTVNLAQATKDKLAEIDTLDDRVDDLDVDMAEVNEALAGKFNTPTGTPSNGYTVVYSNGATQWRGPMTETNSQSSTDDVARTVSPRVLNLRFATHSEVNDEASAREQADSDLEVSVINESGARADGDTDTLNAAKDYVAEYAGDLNEDTREYARELASDAVSEANGYTDEEIAAALADINLTHMAGPYATVEDIPTPYDTNDLYLVGASAPYQVYVVIDGGLVDIGSSDTDLTNYYDKSEVDDKISEVAIKSDELTITIEDGTISISEPILETIEDIYQKTNKLEDDMGDEIDNRETGDSETLESAKEYTDEQISAALGDIATVLDAINGEEE
jgi:hypothetical protein